MSDALAFLTFPTTADGWLAFSVDRPQERIARVRDLDARLRSDRALSARERLELWNDADIALREALSESYVLSEAHPSAEVRAAAEAQAQAVEAVSAGRLLDRALWGAFSELTDDGLTEDEARMLHYVQRDFRRGGVDLQDAARERSEEHTSELKS